MRKKVCEPANVSQPTNASLLGAEALDKLMASMCREGTEFARALEGIINRTVQLSIEDAISNVVTDDAVASLVSDMTSHLVDKDAARDIAEDAIADYDFDAYVRNRYVSEEDVQKVVNEAVQRATPLTDEQMKAIVNSISETVIGTIGKAIAKAFVQMG